MNWEKYDVLIEIGTFSLALFTVPLTKNWYTDRVLKKINLKKNIFKTRNMCVIMRRKKIIFTVCDTGLLMNIM